MSEALGREFVAASRSLAALLYHLDRTMRRCGVVHDADDLVQQAALLMIDGSRRWDPAVVDMRGWIAGAVSSIASAWIKSVDRETPRRAAYFLNERATTILPNPDEERDAVLRGEDLYAEMLAAAGDDRTLRDLATMAKIGGFRRSELAEDLGWGVDVVTAARIKLQRRVLRNRGRKR